MMLFLLVPQEMKRTRFGERFAFPWTYSSGHTFGKIQNLEVASSASLKEANKTIDVL
jgi:hypothetical protein